MADRQLGEGLARWSSERARSLGLGVVAAASSGMLLAHARVSARDVAVIELIAASVILLAFNIACVRRRGLFSPGSLVTAALLVYLPLRALPLMLGHPRAEQGVNPAVLSKLGSESTAADRASLVVLVIALSFLAGYALLAWWSRAQDRRAAGDPSAFNHNFLERLAPALMVVGVAALVIQAVSSLTYLRVGSIEGGFLSQVWQTLAFSFGFGIVIAPRARPGERRLLFWALFTAGVVVATAAGSKDVLVQILVATAVRHSIIGARKDGGGRGLFIGCATVAAVLLIGFPSLNSYRRSVLEGKGSGEALTAIPIELRSKTIVLGKARRDTGVAAYVSDAGLYLSNRLHGFDSLLLGVAAPHDPTLLPVTSVLSSPLAIVLPGRFVDPDQQDIGLLFAHEYWKLPAKDRSHIAIGVFTQGWIAWGWPVVIALGLVLGAMTWAADRCLAVRRPGPAVVGYTLLIGALAMERDLVFVVTSTGKHLLFAALVWLILRRRGLEHLEEGRQTAAGDSSSEPVLVEKRLVHL
ncbi:MAG: hypothetical protein WKF86_04740 [Acidimicrobiales bacterium]